MADSMSVNSLLNSTSQSYTASESLSSNGTTLDSSTSAVTGDRTTAQFKSTSNSQLGESDFLQLLTTQMQYQDPTSPMDDSQMVAQLAQFSALESDNNILTAINNLNTSFTQSVDAQNASAAALTNSSAVSLIGKEARVKQTDVTYSGQSGEQDAINVNLGNNASATVNIEDANGNVVASLTTSGKDDQNSSTVYWDGKTSTGQYAAPGSYTISIPGSDTDSSLYAYVQDTVTGVGFSSQGSTVTVAGQEMPVSNLMSIAGTANDATAGSADSSGLSASSAVALLGKAVRVQDNTIEFAGPQSVGANGIQVKAYLDTMSQATIQILDPNGNVAYQNTVSANSDGTATISWDGTDANTGTDAAPGEYTVRIVGADSDPNVYTYSDGTVDGISNLSGGAQLSVNGKIVSLSSIMNISTQSA